MFFGRISGADFRAIRATGVNSERFLGTFRFRFSLLLLGNPHRNQAHRGSQRNFWEHVSLDLSWHHLRSNMKPQASKLGSAEGALLALFPRILGFSPAAASSGGFLGGLWGRISGPYGQRG